MLAPTRNAAVKRIETDRISKTGKTGDAIPTEGRAGADKLADQRERMELLDRIERLERRERLDIIDRLERPGSGGRKRH